jgi:deazaflavin-dependent oxidoreductase (nitroreductase family)
LTTEHRIGTQEEWQAERDELLKEEKELTRRGDELARRRRELPWVPVKKDYRFETEDGTETLADLFDGRSQLVVYHFMFGPSWSAGCPVCSSIADTLAPQAVHLKARDTTLLLASRAPLEKLLAYRERMGWPIGWVSSAASDFNRDLGFLYTEEELKPFLQGEIPLTVEQNARMCGTDPLGYVTEGPGLSVYALSDGTVYRTYVTTARGLEPAMAYYGLLDRTPKGRDESASEPLWVRRHDDYSADDFNAQIIRDFRTHEGRVGGMFKGTPMLLLHHTGAKSGKCRVNPVAYLSDGDSYVVIASNGGAPASPGWYHNLKAHPNVTIEVGTDTSEVVAREATGEERERLFRTQSGRFPQLAEYEQRTERLIPVVVLTPR